MTGSDGDKLHRCAVSLSHHAATKATALTTPATMKMWEIPVTSPCPGNWFALIPPTRSAPNTDVPIAPPSVRNIEVFAVATPISPAGTGASGSGSSTRRSIR